MNLRDLCRSRILTVFTKVNEDLLLRSEQKNVFSLRNSVLMRFVNL